MSSSPYRSRQIATRQQELAARAHHMRHNQTPTEARLWAELRGSRLGVAFRRQVVIGQYIADFVAPSVRLVVEVDGGVHAARGPRDARRDARLARAGYRVLRIPAQLLTDNVAAAVALVRSALAGS
jgi:very-short-patch-repair endonuclease